MTDVYHVFFLSDLVFALDEQIKDVLTNLVVVLIQELMNLSIIDNHSSNHY